MIDWVRGLIQGVDQLSDAGSLFPNVSSPVFTSMGAWAVGHGGQVHLENVDGDFEEIWFGICPKMAISVGFGLPMLASGLDGPQDPSPD